MVYQLHESTIFITHLKAIIFDTPDAEHAKIQLIKNELLNGSYQINSLHIADKLLAYAPVVEEMEMA